MAHPPPSLHTRFFFGCFAACWLVLAHALPAADIAPLPGTWDGEVTVGGQAVHIRCVFRADPRNPGACQGDFYAKQATAATVMDSVTVTADSIEFNTRADNQPLKFTGRREGRSISGTVTFVRAPAIQGRFTIDLPPETPKPGTKSVTAAAASPTPTSFAGEWEGTFRPSAGGAEQPGTALWLNLEKDGAAWRGTLYIKSREPGYVLQNLVVGDTRLTAQADIGGTQVALTATRRQAGIDGSFSAKDPQGNTQTGSWSAAPATRAALDAPPAAPIGPDENPATPRELEPEHGIPVIPGAEGFGTRTRAGRGGRVIEVTTLADSGEGSLREALLTKGPRTIVFRVGGVIHLKELLFIAEPFVTVAGQTAPGDGICLSDCGLVITTHDVLVQHLRIRPGNTGPVKPSDNDAVCILGDHKQADGGAHHVVLDHLSLSWSEDECLSVWGGAREITVMNCVIAEALSHARHDKTTHSAGLLVGDSSDHVTLTRNLLAHNSFRNPLIAKGGTHEFVNNVIYDWQDGPCEVEDLKSNTFLNFIGNTYRKGPNSTNPARALTVPGGPGKGTPQLYLAGNIDPHHTEPNDNPWLSVGGDWKGAPADSAMRAERPFETRLRTRLPADRAYALVLDTAGATRPARDAVDTRIVKEVREQRGNIINSPTDVGGLPRYKEIAAPALPASLQDSDHDGLPDSWETAHKLNPRNADDGALDADGDGYTNLEEYLHALSAGAVK